MWQHRAKKTAPDRPGSLLGPQKKTAKKKNCAGGGGFINDTPTLQIYISMTLLSICERLLPAGFPSPPSSAHSGAAFSACFASCRLFVVPAEGAKALDNLLGLSIVSWPSEPSRRACFPSSLPSAAF